MARQKEAMAPSAVSRRRPLCEWLCHRIGIVPIAKHTDRHRPALSHALPEGPERPSKRSKFSNVVLEDG